MMSSRLLETESQEGPMAACGTVTPGGPGTAGELLAEEQRHERV